MNYSNMSGYEINNRVHNILVCDAKYDLMVEGYRVTWKNRETGEETVTVRKEYDKQFKNYIRSWSDAGPIIERERITLDSDIDVWFARDDNCCHTHENPLRAAMIVFLMMHEVSK